ncbi:MAG: TolC family protein, partial [Cyclobacteriaceae bacterium]|nr:TolC family protein [Cyclobacteriaceae bacterium]
YEESRREYVEEYELISGISTTYFFEFLTAQISLSIALQNVDSNDTLYQIARGRYDLGKIPESDLLNLELQLMRSQQDVAQAELNLETARLRLKSYLGLNQEESIELITPSEIPEFEVSEELAVEMARKNRSDAIAFKRRMMEADRDVAQAVGGSGLNGRVFSRFGLTNQGDNIGNVYVNPNSQLVADVGLSIPILDWGRQKAVKKTALANQQLARYTLEQEEINFEQEVITHVKRFKMLRNQVTISKKADLVSQKRYDVTKSRYLIGKMEITDLSLALTEKDRAKQTYLTSLGDFWQAYYVLRQLTLYDFATRRLLYDPTQE